MKWDDKRLLMSGCAVVIWHSEDGWVPAIYPFKDEDKASAFLKWKWNYYYNNVVEEPLQENETWCEDNYGKITWSDNTFIALAVVGLSKDEIFDTYYKQIAK